MGLKCKYCGKLCCSCLTFWATFTQRFLLYFGNLALQIAINYPKTIKILKNHQTCTQKFWTCLSKFFSQKFFLNVLKTFLDIQRKMWKDEENWFIIYFAHLSQINDKLKKIINNNLLFPWDPYCIWTFLCIKNHIAQGAFVLLKYYIRTN